MTDVQVSNARRLGFTVLALVSFWVVSFGAYSLGFHMPENLDPWFGSHPWMMEAFFTGQLKWTNPWTYRWLACGLLMALIPLVFLSLSRHNSPIKLRDHRILIGGLLFATCIGCCYWVGELEVIEEASAYPTRWWNHRVPWLWLLLPIILTTAFVIWGAWRRGVRDAEVDVDVDAAGRPS